jgi:hypothetical protein
MYKLCLRGVRIPIRGIWNIKPAIKHSGVYVCATPFGSKDSDQFKDLMVITLVVERWFLGACVCRLSDY